MSQINALHGTSVPAFFRKQEKSKCSIHFKISGCYPFIYINVIVTFCLVHRMRHSHTKKLQWIQCDYCYAWLHSDCAGMDFLAVEAISHHLNHTKGKTVSIKSIVE